MKPKKPAIKGIPTIPDFAFYTLGHAAKIKGYSVGTARNKFDAGQLHGVRASDGQRLINRADLEGAPK